MMLIPGNGKGIGVESAAMKFSTVPESERVTWGKPSGDEPAIVYTKPRLRPEVWPTGR